MMINAAIVAYGLSGRVFHAPFLHTHPKFNLTKVVERNKEESLKRYPYVDIVRSIDELLTDEMLDLVVITSPNTTHYEFAKQALEAGKHVVIEKPFTVTSQEAKELGRLADKKGKILSVYQNRRWDGDFLTVKHIVKNKMLGDLVDFESHFDRFQPLQADQWREKNLPGSGVLYDLGAHLIDQTIDLFGLPHSLTAEIKSQREKAEVDDFFDIRLHYRTHTATLKSSMIVKTLGPRFVLHGTKGSYKKYGIDPQEELLDSGEFPDSPAYKKAIESDQWGQIETEWNGMAIKGKIQNVYGNYTSYYDDIYQAIKENKKPIVTADQAYKTIWLIEQMQKSSEEKRTIFLEGID
ncbi:oxidoreductase [Bacillus gobiensis]|uniref:oxidoreductase n=1 Tax=Bacillus gobiensis TaxID=1441095 RepID=UPI003D1D9801